ncbi:hypothetical protein Q428_09720 [Fervidicella metallireducens AeB]|uniref:GH29D-like beta-sandwich domain-containing protein n=1 Tax=Fervidicella metallireducens AeB TaxID=1403537 RepID=A0A017RU44_9CLOT|nr:chitobiase/beta-hexosaminidase C-terminal domain-containing protein [Fervidicella metallireducens]EYE88101.1 hypothetical protein Q428_09720 [Fervidicella metallireducens AeB]
MKRKSIFYLAIVVILVFVGIFAYVKTLNNAKAAKVKEHIRLGNDYIARERYQEAEREFQEAIKLQPKNTEARIGLSKAYFYSGRTDDGEKILLEVTEIEPGKSEPYIELAKCYLDVDMYDKAVETLKNGYEKIKSEDIKKFLDNIKIKPTAPKTSLEPESYGITQNIKLFTNESDVVIYYTTDGTKPNKNSKRFTAPIFLDYGKTVVKAIAVNRLGVPSEVAEFEYVIEATPFCLTDFKFAGISHGQTLDKVIKVYGNPMNRREEYDAEYEMHLLDLEYDFGKLSFVKFKNNQPYRLYTIELTSSAKFGPRNIKVGDSDELILKRFFTENPNPTRDCKLYEFNERNYADYRTQETGKLEYYHYVFDWNYALTFEVENNRIKKIRFLEMII